MQALILAGGKGTRLRPYTTVLPKPLMPIGDIPILEIVLRQLKSAGVDSVILAVGYMHQLFQSFFEDGSRYKLSIDYSFEDKPLGTAGPIALAMDRLQEDFLIMNGDLLTTLNYAALFQYHKDTDSAATIALHRRTVNIDYGVIDYDKDDQLEGYREKPSFNFDVSMGINVLNKASVEKIIKPNTYLDIPDLMMQLKQQGDLVKCYREECDWLDIGRVDDYQLATELFESNRSKFLPDPS
ncbi:MAG: sugar phosphate nucleotidyltransferase [Desulfobulbaceae bacterium]|nr:sugar phosphate nucleotidyltransferase [Desulfobulbaceae bacterium]